MCPQTRYVVQGLCERDVLARMVRQELLHGIESLSRTISEGDERDRHQHEGNTETRDAKKDRKAAEAFGDSLHVAARVRSDHVG